MAYLLAQYALLFLLTALLSFLLGRWWVQRRYIDITESWESLRASREADEGFRDRLWTGLEELRRSVAPTVRTELAALPQPQLPEPNLDRILMELKRLETRIDGIKPTPAADLKPVHSRLDTLDARLSGLKLPSPPAVDLSPVLDRLAVLEQRLDALGTPEPVDLTGIEQRMAALAVREEPIDLAPLDQQLSALEAMLRTGAERPPAVDLSGVLSRLDAMSNQLAAAAPAAFDPEPLALRLQNLERTLAALPRLERQDLQSIHFRLGAVERLLRETPPGPSFDSTELFRRLAGLEGRLAEQAPAPVAASPVPQEVPATEPELFATPERGAPDDLKRISGVGPKLERLLNQNGVFYFWQVAGWNEAEVRYMDERLEVFRGRIQRDSWVEQARALAAETNPGRPDLFTGS